MHSLRPLGDVSACRENGGLKRPPPFPRVCFYLNGISPCHRPRGLRRTLSPSLSSCCFLYFISIIFTVDGWFPVQRQDRIPCLCRPARTRGFSCRGSSVHTHHQKKQLQDAICFRGKVPRLEFRSRVVVPGLTFESKHLQV